MPCHPPEERFNALNSTEWSVGISARRSTGFESKPFNTPHSFVRIPHLAEAWRQGLNGRGMLKIDLFIRAVFVEIK